MKSNSGQHQRRCYRKTKEHALGETSKPTLLQTSLTPKPGLYCPSVSVYPPVQLRTPQSAHWARHRTHCYPRELLCALSQPLLSLAPNTGHIPALLVPWPHAPCPTQEEHDPHYAWEQSSSSMGLLTQVLAYLQVQHFAESQLTVHKDPSMTNQSMTHGLRAGHDLSACIANNAKPSAGTHIQIV